MVGGRNYDESPFNLATEGERQPGSSFKAFDLAAALEARHLARLGRGPRSRRIFIVPNTQRPGKVRRAQRRRRLHRLEHADRRDGLLGQLDLRRSRAARWAPSGSPASPTAMGITHAALDQPRDDDRRADRRRHAARHGARLRDDRPRRRARQRHAGRTAARRSASRKSTRGGQRAAGRRAPRRQPRQGKRVLPPRRRRDRDLDARNRDAVRHRNAPPRSAQFAAGKTGTTTNYGDAWFVGWDSKYTVAVWVGYPDRLIPMTTEFNGGPVLGGTYPALIWHDFMVSAMGIDKERAEQAAAHVPKRARRQAGTEHDRRSRRSGATSGSAAHERPARQRRTRRGHGNPDTGRRRPGKGGEPPAALASASATPSPSAPPTPTPPSAPAEPSPHAPGRAHAQAAAPRPAPEADRRRRAPAASAARRAAGATRARLPAAQKRQGSSTARVIPTRSPTTIAGSRQARAGAPRITTGPPDRSPPLSASSMPSAWVSLPGPEQSVRSSQGRAPARRPRRARISVDPRQRLRARGSAPPRRRPRARRPR